MMLLVLRLRLKKLVKLRKLQLRSFCSSVGCQHSKKPYLQCSLAKVIFYAQNSVGQSHYVTGCVRPFVHPLLRSLDTSSTKVAGVYRDFLSRARSVVMPGK